MPIRLETATEFVELEVTKTRLKRTVGTLGSRGESQSWNMVTVAQAKTTLAEQIAKYTALGFVETKPIGAAPEPVKPFPAVTAKAFKTLLGKLAKAEDHDDIEAALGNAIDEANHVALAWHTLCSVAQPGVQTLLSYLATLDKPIDAIQAGQLAAFLRRSLEPARHLSDDWFAGWQRTLDKLVYQAVASFPDAFAEHEAHYPPISKAGLLFVRGRLHRILTTTERHDVLRRLAHAQATEYGICAGKLPMLDAFHHPCNLSVIESDPKPIVSRFGDEAEWARALALEAPFNRWNRIQYVGAAVVVMPLDVLVTMVASRPSDPFGYAPNAEGKTLALLALRQDPPQALLDATAVLPESPYAYIVREVFAYAAARAWLARGELVPETFYERIGEFALPSDDAGEVALDVLRKLPRERVLDLVRDRIEHQGQAVAALGAHYDAEIFEAFLARNQYESGSVLGFVGGFGLSALAKSIDSCPDELVAPRREGLVRAMKRVIASGEKLDEIWDDVLAKPLKASDDLRLDVIALLEPARRDRIMGRA